MSSLVYEIITEVYTPPSGFSYGSTYESIIFPEGYEKPPKEEFEAKLQELIDAQPWKELRTERNKRIAQADYLAIPDYPHPTEETKQAWLDYRQALRDLPANTTDPENPAWPTPP
jgi:hypothetical protein